VSGVQAGDYDYAEFISGDLYGILKDDPALKIHLSGAPIFGLVFMNSKNGPLADNYPLRRAILTALDMAEALRVTVGEESLRSANSSFFPEGNIWFTEAGTESYSVGDPEKAKEMAEAAGYDGSPITLLVSTNYKTHFDQATVFTRKLADAGIGCKGLAAAPATLGALRVDRTRWRRHHRGAALRARGTGPRQCVHDLPGADDIAQPRGPYRRSDSGGGACA
jgi:peptide/nickel transport system substrate-binding protein